MPADADELRGRLMSAGDIVTHRSYGRFTVLKANDCGVREAG